MREQKQNSHDPILVPEDMGSATTVGLNPRQKHAQRRKEELQEQGEQEQKEKGQS
ncbi:MAG: hypothetical protein QHH75_09370 [Bacillota bacterium]|nr:hypothetical protein [Bacillota bacterium]